MKKYTLFEQEMLKSIDNLNYYHNKLSARMEELVKRIDVLESLVNAPPVNDCYDSSQVCKMASVSIRTLQRWRKDGKIVYRKIMNRYYYPKNDFCEMMSTKKLK